MCCWPRITRRTACIGPSSSRSSPPPPSRPTRNDSDMKLARHHFQPIAVLAAIALSSAGAPAQPAPQRAVPDELDLKTAIGFALQNNFAIRQARERIKQQEGVVIEVS